MKYNFYHLRTGNRIVMWLLIASLLLPGVSCKIFTTVTTPVESCVYRGSLISVDIPPITLTPSRTAAERQLVGDDRELEKDGWLIASMESSQKRDVSQATEAGLNETRRYYRDLSILEFYNDLITDYRRGGVLGESYDGHLKLVPASLSPRTGHFANPAEIENARTIAGEVNLARDRIYEYQKKQSEKEDDSEPPPGDSADQMEQRIIHRRSYYEHVRSGEWVFSEKNEWIRVP